MNEEQKVEFQWFQGLCDRITNAFAAHPDAQDIGFCVAQAVRDVPALLRVLENEKSSDDEVKDAVHAVVSNHLALSEANKMLTTY